MLRRRADAPFTYRHVGATAADLPAAPAGFLLDRYGAVVGEGRPAFERCRAALERIDNYPRSFTRIVHADDAELAPGSLFGTVVQHFGFASAHPCRLIYVVDEPDRFGFGFGTLPGHAESGEERFLVRLESGRVHYDVQAFSRPVGLLPRLGAPITRSFQLRFQRETLETMKSHAR
ncbi:MAG: DUF1990 domain-containing protein [Deltaproteobacteria bacterium]|nr:DUF1990 domain-containing protein [Deltaproteobacteria bacterium]